MMAICWVALQLSVVKLMERGLTVTSQGSAGLMVIVVLRSGLCCNLCGRGVCG